MTFKPTLSDRQQTEGKPREFWIKNKANEYTDDQFWATEKEEYDTDIHVIEYAAVEIAQNALIDSESENVRLHEENAALKKQIESLRKK